MADNSYDDESPTQSGFRFEVTSVESHPSPPLSPQSAPPGEHPFFDDQRYSCKFPDDPDFSLNRSFTSNIRRRLTSGKRRNYRRLVFKNGECNISHINIHKRHQRYLSDIFTTLVDVQWRYALLLFVMAFILSWLGFTVIWWLICYANYDFSPNLVPEDHVKCVANVEDFSSALLFSIETQHTIGYGSRYVTNKCPEAIILVMVQSCFGVIVQALMTGLVFAKISRPKKRAETLMFSKNAVICKRDGIMTLLFRVGDMRKSHIIDAHIRGILIKKRITHEGEVLPLEQYHVDFSSEMSPSDLFLVWPVIVEHEINDKSPFYQMSSFDMKREQFELIVILEGIVESTGMTTQARSSYLPSEIHWGHRFEKLITYQKTNGQYQIDYEKFNGVLEIPHFPSCSAADLATIGEDNMSAKGFVHDDDISLASKSVTLTMGTSRLVSQLMRKSDNDGLRRSALKSSVANQPHSQGILHSNSNPA